MMLIDINNIRCKIMTTLTLDQLSVLSQLCSFKVEGAEFKANAFKHRGRSSYEWDGYRRLFNAQKQDFPIGLLPKVINLFNTLGVSYNIDDHRTHMDPTYPVKCIGSYEKRDYQRDAVFTSIMYGGGTVKSATGSGKTTMAALTIEAIGKPTVFIVHTKDLLYQTKSSFEHLFGCEIGQIGDGIIDPKFITIATVQTLSKASGSDFYESYSYDEDMSDGDDASLISYDNMRFIRKWAMSIGMVLFDEVQRVCSRTAYAARYMFPNADHAFGYSASPWRDDGCDLMIEAAFGPVITDINASSLIRQGYLVKPIIIIKNVKSTVWSGKTYSEIYQSAIVDNLFRNMQVVNDAFEQYKLGRTTLVLVTYIKHGEVLEKMLRSLGAPAVFISGKSHIKHRKQVIQDMRDGKAPIVIASTIADVGLDVPRIQSMVEAGAGKSSVTALQRVGRAIRKFDGKDLAYYVTYRDNAPFLNTQIDNKIRIWSTEPEFVIKEE